jgi:hypothetical protein
MPDFLIFLILAGLALAFRWLTNQAAEASKKPGDSQPNESSPRSPAESEEERVRKFLEALGVPPGTMPPPPVKRRPVKPRRASPTEAPPAPRKVRRSFVQPLPPLVTTPEELAPPAQTFEPTPPPQPFPEEVVVRVEPLQEPVEPRAIPPLARAPAATVPSSSLRVLLRNRDSLRQAIILREILGLPRGLQSLEQS